MIYKLFFLTYGIANLCLIFYGVLVLLGPSILLEPFLTHVYRFPDEATKATTYLEALYRLLGYFNLIPGLFGLILLLRARISHETWISRIVVISTSSAYLGPIVFDNTVGRIGPFEIIEHILFASLIILGIMIWNTPWTSPVSKNHTSL